MTGINELWIHGSEADWKYALNKYYEQPSAIANEPLEKKMEALDPESVKRMSGQEFYRFLYDDYFVWKYTAKNRLATCRKSLRKYEDEKDWERLEYIKRSIFKHYECDPIDTELLLEDAKKINGLGIAGASGLLSILFPNKYGTVDQFVVDALCKIDDLTSEQRQKLILAEKRKESLKTEDGVFLIGLLRVNSNALNKQFGTNFWTPRKIDMVLWTYGH